MTGYIVTICHDDWDDGSDGDDIGSTFTFDLDYGLHINGDEDAENSARDLQTGDTFQDPAYDGPGEWHTVTGASISGDTVHVHAED